MNYHIELIQGTSDYSVSYHDKIKKVSQDFLKSKLKDYKYEELLRDNYANVRDNWDELDSMENFIHNQGIVKSAPISTSEIKNDDRVDKLSFRNGEYIVNKSKHSKLYELWRLEERASYHFVAYFFELSSIDTLINEDLHWRKYEKALRKSIHEFDVPAPSEGDS